jgi:hypothetical protein
MFCIAAKSPSFKRGVPTFAKAHFGHPSPRLKSQEINLDYILELIFDHNKMNKSKATLIEEVRRLIRASLGNSYFLENALLFSFVLWVEWAHFWQG